MKPGYLLTAVLFALPLTAATGSASAADACKNVKFTVTNNHFEGREIEIRKVKYTNPHNDGKEQTEDVKNKVCKHGDTCTTAGDNLSNADKPLTDAATLLPDNSVVQDHLGDLRFRQQRYADAVAAWERALAGDGDVIDRAAIEKKMQDARGRIKQE